jgi:hypothetical protein
VQKAKQPKSPAKKKKEKTGDYFERLSMTLTNLTRRNKDYRSKTRRKTKLQQQQQMREEKQSIGFERCLQVQKLDAKFVCKGKRKFWYAYK